MTPAQVSVRKAWEAQDICFKLALAAWSDAARETYRDKRLLLASRRAIPYAECLERLLARS